MPSIASLTIPAPRRGVFDLAGFRVNPSSVAHTASRLDAVTLTGCSEFPARLRCVVLAR